MRTAFLVTERYEPAAAIERREVTEFLHAVSQPMTALICALEIALRGDRSTQDYRRLLDQALTEAKRIATAARDLRARIQRP